jgi:hypothetical protein
VRAGAARRGPPKKKKKTKTKNKKTNEIILLQNKGSLFSSIKILAKFGDIQNNESRKTLRIFSQI